MTPEEIHKRLSKEIGEEIEWQEGACDSCAVVSLDKWVEACSLARTDAGLQFDFLRSFSGVDRPDENKIEIVAHLFSYQRRHSFVLKTSVDRSRPSMKSISEIWPAAVWYERECFDLLGITFLGNPDLRRIMLPEDWVGHPLRKDYEEGSAYHGIPTTRPGYEKAKPKKAKKKKAKDKPKDGSKEVAESPECEAK